MNVVEGGTAPQCEAEGQWKQDANYCRGGKFTTSALACQGKNSVMPRIVVDTREQQPYAFENSIQKGLKAGDYSLEGFEDSVAVERKSKADAYSSLGVGRERFKREFERLSKYPFAAVVIECSLEDFLNPPPLSKMNPKSAIESLNSWSIEFGVHVKFAGTRELGMDTTQSYLRHFLRLYNEKRIGGNECEE